MTNVENNKYIINYVEELMKDSRPKIYISGPISIYNDDKYALSIFTKKQQEIEEHIKKGGTFNNGEIKFIEDIMVINPAYYNTKLKGYKNLTWGDYMAYDFLILNQCQYIFMLDKWEVSDGAKMENMFAKKCGITVITKIDEWS